METFQSIFDGLMLSDGSLCKQRNSARYQHTCKHREYIDYLLDLSRQCGVSYAETNPHRRQDISLRWSIFSRVHPWLTQEHSRWYSNGKKIIPQNISLSSENLLHLYLGDGSLQWKKEYLEGLELSIQGFALPYRLFLQEYLLQLGFPFRMDKVGKLILKRSRVLSFLQYIGKPLLFHCYDYKWMIEDRLEYNRLKNSFSYLTDNQQPSL